MSAPTPEQQKLPTIVAENKPSRKLWKFSGNDWPFTGAYASISLMIAMLLNAAVLILVVPFWGWLMWRYKRGRMYSYVYNFFAFIALMLNSYEIYNPDKNRRLRQPPFNTRVGSVVLPKKSDEEYREIGVTHDADTDMDSVYIAHRGSPYSGLDFEDMMAHIRMLAGVWTSTKAFVDYDIGIQYVRRLRPVNPNPFKKFEMDGMIQADIVVPEALTLDDPLDPKQLATLSEWDQLRMRQNMLKQSILRVNMMSTLHPTPVFKITFKRSALFARALSSNDVSEAKLKRDAIVAAGRQLVSDLRELGYVGVSLMGLCEVHEWIREGWDTDLTEYRKMQREGIVPTSDKEARRLIDEKIEQGVKDPYQEVFKHYPDDQLIKAHKDHLTIGDRYFAVLEITERPTRLSSMSYNKLYGVRKLPSNFTVIGQTFSGTKETKMIITGISARSHLDTFLGAKMYESASSRQRKQNLVQADERYTAQSVGQSSNYLILISGKDEDELQMHEDAFKSAGRLSGFTLERVIGRVHQWPYFVAANYANGGAI